jgi:hypothetical protein
LTHQIEAGYGASIYVHSNKKADGNEIFDTAKRLHKTIKEKDEEVLRAVKIIKRDEKKGIADDIVFSILASADAICAQLGQMPSEVMNESTRVATSNAVDAISDS